MGVIPQVVGCVAVFSFAGLCEQAMGAADYIALCKAFHTIAVDGLPIVTPKSKSAAYRFVTLIDVAYEHQCRMLIAAEGPPHKVFGRVYGIVEGKKLVKDGAISSVLRKTEDGEASIHRSNVSEEEIVIDENLGFVKERTVSRLIEMQSSEYLEHHAQQRAPELLLALREKRGK